MLTISFQSGKSLAIKPYQTIGLSAVTGLALAACMLYFCYLCLLAILLGLQLVVSTYTQLSELISSTPILHFSFVLGVLCLVVILAKWMLVQTRRYVLIGVR